MTSIGHQNTEQAMKTHRAFQPSALLPSALLLLITIDASPLDAGPEASADSGPPSIIFLMADDMGFADAGCYGQERIRTPRIDRMAAEGTRFTRVYAGSPVCAPSRSVLMTGLDTGHTRVRGNSARVGGIGAQRRLPLRPEDITVAEVLSEAGYVCGMTGKWGLGEPKSSGEPLDQGFDEWFGYLNQRAAHSYYPPYLWKNREKVVLRGNADGAKGEYSHDLITEFALDFIRRHGSVRGDDRRPFFLYVPWCIPHSRYEIPDLGPYADEPWPKNARVHAAMLSRMDRDVGRILDLLAELSIDDSTVVFFTSDNGAAERWEGVFDSSGPLRGRKRDVYEGGLRVPMLVRWPGRVAAARVSDAVWTFADFLPTAAALAGVDPPEGLDGRSVLPVLLGETERLPERTLYWEFHEKGLHQAALREPWKAVRHGAGQPVELYDLRHDVGETRDVSAMHPAITSALAAFLDGARVPSENWPTELDRARSR